MYLEGYKINSGRLKGNQLIEIIDIWGHDHDIFSFLVEYYFENYIFSRILNIFFLFVRNLIIGNIRYDQWYNEELFICRMV